MKHLVITVHGIRTFGDWQKRFKDLVLQRDRTIEVEPHNYGYFSLLAFVLPFTRFIETRRFRRRLLTLVAREPWDRIDIVAHSFGTHLVAWALASLRPEQRPSIHTIILSGSVLKSTFRWDELLGDSVRRLVNDCGTKDTVLLLNQLFVLFTGMAGRLGLHGFNDSDRFRNRFFAFGHSGYFLQDGAADNVFMRDRWVPLFMGEGPIPEVDERGRLSPLQGILLVALNNAEPIKLFAYVLPLLLLIGWIFGQWREAVATRLAAESIAVAERQPDLALLLSSAAAREATNESVRNALLSALDTQRWVKAHLRDHDGEVSGLAFTPDGSLLASVQATNGKKVMVRRTSDLGVVMQYPLEAPRDPAVRLVGFDGYGAVEFTSDGTTLLLTAASDDALEIVSTTDGKLVDRLEPGYLFAVHAASRRIAWATPSGVSFRDDSRAFLMQGWWQDRDIQGLSFMADGSGLLAWTQDRILLKDIAWVREDRFGDGDSWYLKETDREIPTGMQARTVALAPDRQLVAAADESTLRIWDYETGRLVHELGGPQENLMRAVAFWPGRNLLVSAGGGGSTGSHSMSVWSTEDGALVGSLQVGFELATTTLAFSSDGRWLASGDRRGNVVLWDFGVEQPHLQLSRRSMWSTERPTRIAVSPTKPSAAALLPSGEVVFVDLAHDSVVARPGESATGIVYSPNGTTLYSWESEGSVSRWDPRRHQRLASELVLPGGGLLSVTVDGSGRRLALLDSAGRVYVVSARSLVPETGKLEHDSSMVAAVSFAPGSRLLYTAEPNLLRVWDLGTGQEQARFLAQAVWMAVAPGGRRMAVAERFEFEIGLLGEAEIRVLGTPSLESFDTLVFAPRGASLQGHTEPISALAFSPDGEVLASASSLIPPADGRPRHLEDALLAAPLQTIRLWQGSTGKPLGPPLVFSSSSITQLAFSSDSRSLLSLSETGEVVVWRTDPKALAARAAALANRELSAGERLTYFEHESFVYRTLSAAWRISLRLGAGLRRVYL